MAASDEINPEADSDESLMHRFQNGDENAFKALFDRHAPRIINFAYRLLGTRQESEDLAQEVFLRVYTKKDRYDPLRSFRTWIYSIASRLAFNKVRDRKRHPHASLSSAGTDSEKYEFPPPALELADKEPSANEILEQKETITAVRNALQVLPEEQRTAVILSRFEEMSYEEIARTMQMSVSAVKSLIFRARQTLTKLLSYLTDIK